METPLLWNKGSSERVVNNPVQDGFNFDKANDILKLGLLFLNCAMGTLDFHYKATTLYEGLRHIMEDIHKSQESLKDYCCLIHSEN